MPLTGTPQPELFDGDRTLPVTSTPGASLRDLMTRMGHDSPRAAMIYQHATSVEDRAIADRLSGLVDAHRSESGESTRTDDPDEDDDG